MNSVCEAIELSKALLTPLVALIAVGVAYRQWRTAHDKVLLDLFDRRFAIYEMFLHRSKLFLREEVHSKEIDNDLFEALLKGRFLFGKDARSMFGRVLQDMDWLRDNTDKAIMQAGDERDALEQEKLVRRSSVQSWPVDAAKVLERYMLCDQKLRW